MDSVGALLRSMVSAVRSFDGPYFNQIAGDKKYRAVIPYIDSDAIPSEWFHDMRIAGTEPTWIVEEQAIFQHADGRRASGRIAVGFPSSGYQEIKPWCEASLAGLEDRPAWREEAETPLRALRLAMSSMDDKLRAFVAGGGRVLKPDGSEVDLDALLGAGDR